MEAEFRVLGPVQASFDGQLLPVASGKQRVLLASLLLQANRVVPVEWLAVEIWGHGVDLTVRTRSTLQTYLMRLRQRMAPLDVIRTTESGYVLEVEPDLIDVERFRRSTQAGRAAANAGDLEHAASAYSGALREWRGSPLANVDSERIRLEEVPGLLEERSLAQEQFIDVRLALGQHAEVLADLSRLTSEHPLRERFWTALMLTLYRSGRQAEALDAYQRVRTRLLEDLGISPGPDLQELHQRILTADPTLEQPAGRPLTTSPVGAGERQRIPHQLPLDIAGFAGRERELRELDELLGEYDADLTAAGALVATLDGSPGVGKTALAVRWAHRVADRFPDGQLYLNLRGYGPGEPVEAGTALEILLHALGVHADQIPADQDARSMLLRSELADRRVLLVLDNARNTHQVRPLLPGAGRVVAIVTSRSQLRGLTVAEGAHRITVAELAHPAAVDLLARLAGSDRTAAEPAAVDRLVAACGRLPLALRILAERIARLPSVPLHTVADELRNGTLAILEASNEDDTSLRAVFDTSYTAIPPPAARLFRLLGLHPGPDISVPAAAAIAGILPIEASRQLDALASAHLIEQHHIGRYSLHDLLREYAADKATMEPERETAWERLCDYYLRGVTAATRFDFTSPIQLPRPAPDETLFHDSHSARAWLDTERANLVATATKAGEHGPPKIAWHLADALRTYLCATRYTTELRALTDAGMSAAQQSGNGLAEATMEFSLGAMYGLVDDERTTLHLERAFAGFERLNYSLGAALCGVSIGVGYAKLDEYQRSVELLERSREVFSELGRDDILAQISANLCYILAHLGRLPEALDQADRGVAICRPSGDRIELSTLLGNRSYPRQLTGDSAGARADLDEALALLSELDLGFGVASTHIALAQLEAHDGNLDAGIAQARRGLEAAERLRDVNQQTHGRNALGLLHRLRGDPDLAIEHHLLVTETGDGHVKARAESHLGLAAARRAKADLTAALDDARRALDLAQGAALRIIECDAYLEIAAISQDLGRAEDATNYAKQARRIQELTGYHPPPWRNPTGRP